MHWYYWRIVGILLILCATLFSGLLLNRPLWTFHIDVGNEPHFIIPSETSTFYNYIGFHASEMWGERSFRWTKQRTTVTIPWVMRMQPLLMTMTACGCQPNGQNTDASLILNNTLTIPLDATQHWRQYHILVPTTLTHPDYGLMVDIRVPTPWTDAYARVLGLALDSIALRQIGQGTLTDPVSVLVVVLGIGVLVWQRQWLMQPFLLCVAWLLVNAIYQPQLLPRAVVTSILVGGLLLLWQCGIASSKPWRSWRLGGSIPTLIFTLIAIWLVLSSQILGTWVIDDAFISFRYAQHFIQGNGLVFNAGERVEGYTNFLWTMVIAGVMQIGADPVLIAVALTFVLGFVIVALTLVLARTVVPTPWVWVAPTLLAVSTPFLLYTSRGSGMETALFTALLVATLVALVYEHWLLAGVLAVLTILTRPDGVILAAVGGLYALWHSTLPSITTKDTKQVNLGPFMRYTVVVFALFVPYFIWRWMYYGYPLPNTFYVKVDGTTTQLIRGIHYLWQFGIEDLLLFLGMGGILSGAWFWRHEHHREYTNTRAMVLMSTLVGVFACYVVFVGGDWMPGARFLVPITPLLALLSAWGFAGLARQTIYTMALALVISVGSITILALRLPHESTHHHSEVWIQDYSTRRYREIGRWIYAHTPTDVTIATGIAGALPYYAERPMIDILGLTDEHIAHLPPTHLGHERPGHEKTDVDYVLGRRPEIIPYKGSSLLWQHPDFKVLYRSMQFDGPEGHAVKLYVREGVQLQE